MYLCDANRDRGEEQLRNWHPVLLDDPDEGRVQPLTHKRGHDGQAQAGHDAEDQGPEEDLGQVSGQEQEGGAVDAGLEIERTVY